MLTGELAINVSRTVIANRCQAIIIKNVQKLTSLNLVLRTTIMTPVKPQISKFKAEKSCQVGFKFLTCYDGSTHERLLS